ncbi:hypothetical protein GC088_06290 [Arthrobacter sp. JZ12]|uniref:hypothetical protein n=1 Tax=Arthrobacter sp. JZ12 TaxID=2654190 RepID=UPI002B484468|nr:hypothetical protein [Arthrobacter sp. JZ12]WRH24716.1 hypothetical protein GC088_06290 [Arthrobacter sp. JZ12]
MSPRPQEPNESTDDAIWQDLVARLENTPSSSIDPEAGSPSGTTAEERVRAIFEAQPALDAGGPRDYTAADDDESYQPPEPPALGVGDPLVVLAWLGAVCGPISLVLITMFWRSAPSSVMLGIVAVVIASVSFLIFRLPKTRDYDDDGAAV